MYLHDLLCYDKQNNYLLNELRKQSPQPTFFSPKKTGLSLITYQNLSSHKWLPAYVTKWVMNKFNTQHQHLNSSFGKEKASNVLRYYLGYFIPGRYIIIIFSTRLRATWMPNSKVEKFVSIRYWSASDRKGARCSMYICDRNRPKLSHPIC